MWSEDVFVWLIGSPPYLLLLALGIFYCVLRTPRNPHIARWTFAALVAAGLAWVLRPFLTDWPWLLIDQSTDWLIYHSFASALLDVVPMTLLIGALAPDLREPMRVTVESIREPERPIQRSGSVRWGGLLIGGVVSLALFLSVSSWLFPGQRAYLLLALAGAAPCLLLLVWIANSVLSNGGSSFATRATTWALAAWLVAWFVRPVSLGSIDDGHPFLRVFVSSLCSGIPIGLLALAALAIEADAAAREAPARQARFSAGQFLWVFLGANVGAIVSAVLFVIGLAVCVGGTSGGHGAWPGPGFDELLIGTPLALLLGFLAGGVLTALKLRRGLSLRRYVAVGAALYLMLLTGLFAWNALNAL